MHRQQLQQHLNTLLQVEHYRDYAPNGLQVEGKTDISKVVCGVTASQELIEQAIAVQADAIIVHHGYFWKAEDAAITGMKQRRIKALLANDINLYAYHLPLDGHAELGNNARLAALWDVKDAAPTAEFELLWTGQLPSLSVADFSAKLTQTLQRQPLVISGGEHPIRRLAWCSGGAQGYLPQAASLGVDAYVSGEVSEKTYHEAREYGVHYFAAGHHATERGGVQALTAYLNNTLKLSAQFIDCPNPV